MSANSPPGGVEFERIFKEAIFRWLRPTEIYDILTHNCYFKINKEPLYLPPSGTLVLFDRKLLRNFRRDGHPWRKKKDNKTVKEAHEHLKVGSEEKIHVYYAHGDGESNLQRRVYWLLDKKLEHIVLVHYLEVKEGIKSNIQPAFQVSPVQEMQYSVQPYYPTLSPNFTDADSSQSLASSSVSIQMDFPALDSNQNGDFDTFSIEELHSTGETNLSNAGEPHWPYDSTAFTGQQTMVRDDLNAKTRMPRTSDWDSDSWMTNNIKECNDDQVPYLDNSNVPIVQMDNNRKPNIQDPAQYYNNSDMSMLGNGTQYFHEPVESSMIQVSTIQSTSVASSFNNDIRSEINGVQWQQNQQLAVQMQWADSENGVEKTNFDSGIENVEMLKKLDSLDRWMQKELPFDNKTNPVEHAVENHIENKTSPLEHSKTSPIAASVNSCSYLDTTTPEVTHHGNGGYEVAWQSPISEELSIACPQNYFEIIDYSPNWSYLNEESKVLVTGRYNGVTNDFFKIKWICVFGDIQVPAEVIQFGVLRCLSPRLSFSGSVPLFVTDGSGHPCSDCKTFDIRTGSEAQKPNMDEKTDQLSEYLQLQCRLTELLLRDDDTSGKCSMQNFEENERSILSRLETFTNNMDQQWIAIIKGQFRDVDDVKEQILQIMFKHTLFKQVLRKAALDGKSWLSFDKGGQTVYHLASALGYEWIIEIMLASNVSIDFRDKNGWSALHWAAYYGREKMVASLLAAGAKPGTVSDPTPTNPAGCTPADIASSRGFTGLAGYLSEKSLESHLRMLTLEENDRDKKSADQDAHRIVEYLRRSVSLRRSVKTEEDELALEASLSAVGNATTASSRIQAAFREYFMRERLRAIEEDDEYGFSFEEQLAVQKIQRAYRKHRDQKVKSHAALQIQNHFRTWKNRREFLTLRKSVIKIQAFYRMHVARKQYQKLVWSVGILEKAILRWRQRGKGLRGYIAESKFSRANCEGDGFLAIGRKQAAESLERSVILVQSMVRSRLARQQYKRMKDNFM